MCARRRSPSKHMASMRPFPSILRTWAYSRSRNYQGYSSCGKGGRWDEGWPEAWERNRGKRDKPCPSCEEALVRHRQLMMGKEQRQEKERIRTSLKINSRFSLSFSFFPRLRFLPPYIPRLSLLSPMLNSLTAKLVCSPFPYSWAYWLDFYCLVVFML